MGIKSSRILALIFSWCFPNHKAEGPVRAGEWTAPSSQAGWGARGASGSAGTERNKRAHTLCSNIWFDRGFIFNKCIKNTDLQRRLKSTDVINYHIIAKCWDANCFCLMYFLKFSHFSGLLKYSRCKTINSTPSQDYENCLTCEKRLRFLLFLLLVKISNRMQYYIYMVTSKLYFS